MNISARIAEYARPGAVATALTPMFDEAQAELAAATAERAALVRGGG